MKYRLSGFSLIELLVVVAIIAFLTSLAAPSFNTLLVKRSVQAATSDFVADLRLARSEALRRSTTVTVCALAANSTSSCSAVSPAWTNGWMVFMDVNANGTVDAADEVIRVAQSPASIATIQRSPTPSNTLLRFIYQPNGWAKAPATETLIFTPRGTVPAGTVQCVIVSNNGRTSVAKTGETGCP